MFTKTSKPLRVPVSSFSPFIITQMGEPTHRSMSSDGMRWLGLPAVAAFFGLIMATSALVPESPLVSDFFCGRSHRMQVEFINRSVRPVLLDLGSLPPLQ